MIYDLSSLTPTLRTHTHTLTHSLTHSHAYTYICLDPFRDGRLTWKRMGGQLFGPVSRSTKPYTLRSIIQAMEDACVDIEDEVASLDVQAAAILTDVRATVAALDGLHSGRRTEADSGIRSVAEGALMDLQNFERVCNDESKW